MNTDEKNGTAENNEFKLVENNADTTEYNRQTTETGRTEQEDKPIPEVVEMNKDKNWEEQQVVTDEAYNPFADEAFVETGETIDADLENHNKEPVESMASDVSHAEFREQKVEEQVHDSSSVDEVEKKKVTIENKEIPEPSRLSNTQTFEKADSDDLEQSHVESKSGETAFDDFDESSPMTATIADSEDTDTAIAMVDAKIEQKEMLDSESTIMEQSCVHSKDIFDSSTHAEEQNNGQSVISSPVVEKSTSVDFSDQDTDLPEGWFSYVTDDGVVRLILLSMCDSI